MNEDDWDYLPGTWNVFENFNGWRIALDTDRLPARWGIDKKKEYAARLLYALNHGMPVHGDKLNVAGEPSDGR